MIYACLRFLQEWAHPLTVIHFTLLGMGSQLLFALPLFLLSLLGTQSALVWLDVVLLQFVGLLAERWVFFAQTRHPQNLY